MLACTGAARFGCPYRSSGRNKHDMVGSETVLRTASSMDIHEVGNELILFDTEREIAISLNVSARAIWELCDGARSVSEICAVLRDDLGTSAPGTLEQDVHAAVVSLLDLGAVSPCGTSHPCPDATA